jgi:hypothetical protein
MYLNIKNGTFLDLNQVSMEVNAASGQTIERGLLTYQTGSELAVAGTAQATAGNLLYLALGASSGHTELFAADGPFPGAVAGVPAGGKVTVLSITPSLVIETEAYDDGESYAAGDALTVGAGGLFTPHVSGRTLTGVVLGSGTAADNLGAAVAGWRTGRTANVLTIQTLFVPKYATA